MFTDYDLSVLSRNGFLIKQRFASRESVHSIMEDACKLLHRLPSSINYTDYLVNRSFYRFELPSLPAVSFEAMKVMLDHDLLGLAEKYFNAPAYVAEFELRGSLRVADSSQPYLDGNILHTHTDLPLGSQARSRNGLYFFLALTDIFLENGPTFLFSGSHKLDCSAFKCHVDDNFLAFSDYEKVSQDIELKVCSPMLEGDLLIFDMDIWHGRLPAQKPGRYIAMLKLSPPNQSLHLENLLVGTEGLSKLSHRQLASLIGQEIAGQRPSRFPTRLYGHKSNIRRFDFLIQRLQSLLIYILRLKLFLIKILSAIMAAPRPRFSASMQSTVSLNNLFRR